LEDEYQQPRVLGAAKSRPRDSVAFCRFEVKKRRGRWAPVKKRARWPSATQEDAGEKDEDSGVLVDSMWWLIAKGEIRRCQWCPLIVVLNYQIRTGVLDPKPTNPDDTPIPEKPMTPQAPKARKLKG